MRLPMLVLIAAVAVCAGLYFSSSDKPNPEFTRTPVQVMSQGAATVCAEDKRDDAYQTTIKSNAGKITPASHVKRVYNTGRNGSDRLIWFADAVSYRDLCSQYTAPYVSKETYVTLSVWRDGDKTDEVEVLVYPSAS